MSIRAKLLHSTLVRLIGWSHRPSWPIARQRNFLRLLGFFSPPLSATCVELSCNKVPCTLVRANGVADDAPILLYFHGGGHVIGSPYAYRDLAGQISRALSCRVLMPDYRLAPESPYPAGIDDVYQVWQWVLQQGQLAQNTFIAGDSAGGGIAAALMLRLKANNESQPAKAWLLSPFCDLTFSGASYASRAHRDLELSAKTLKHWAAALLPLNQVTEYPELNPCSENLEGLPPLCIQVGTEEVLLDDSRMLRDNALKHGVQCDYSEWRGMWHVFAAYGRYAPEPKQAFNAAMAFFKE